MPFRLPGILDLREYEALKYAWKLSPNFKPHPERAIEVAGLGGSPLHAGFSFAQLERAKATRQGGDGFGEMIWRCYFTQDSRLTRRMVLLAEGPLLVVDILEPGEDADGYTAGPSWALPPGASAEPHGRGFLEAGFERTPPGDAAVRQSLLSLFGTRDGQKAVLQAARGTCRIAVQQTLKARQTATFVSLMIPCRGAASATTMADNVTINSTQDGAASVSLRTETAAVEITVQTDGTWNVQRRVRQTD
jgi:hypothetical protein